MPRRHRSHSTEFKRQVVAEYHGGETLHALGRRHDLSRNLIRIWIEKAEAGALDEDVAASELMAEYEARISVRCVRRGRGGGEGVEDDQAFWRATRQRKKFSSRSSSATTMRAS